MFHVTRDLVAGKKTCIDLISIPFFVLSFLFICLIYNQALNLNLNNLKFTFEFFYLLHSTFTIFGPVGSTYLISVDDGIYINKLELYY